MVEVNTSICPECFGTIVQLKDGTWKCSECGYKRKINKQKGK